MRGPSASTRRRRNFVEISTEFRRRRVEISSKFRRNFDGSFWGLLGPSRGTPGMFFGAALEQIIAWPALGRQGSPRAYMRFGRAQPRRHPVPIEAVAGRTGDLQRPPGPSRRSPMPCNAMPCLAHRASNHSKWSLRGAGGSKVRGGGAPRPVNVAELLANLCHDVRPRGSKR